MSDKPQLIIINTGSTSTKIARFIGGNLLEMETIQYSNAELAACSTINDQIPLRRAGFLKFLADKKIYWEKVSLLVSRGGIGRPTPAGAYLIDEAMCRELLSGKFGTHPSALGPAIALDLAREYGIKSIVIDPPSTDELQELARISGLPEITRKSAFHALNQKTAARRLARELGKKYEDINCIVAHLGGGITVGAHQKGLVIDCTNGLSEGPLTPERAGTLPTTDLLNLAFSGEQKNPLMLKIVGRGGMAAYLGTKDARMVETMITGGNEKAKLVYEAMAYQIAKEIGSMSAVLEGNLSGIILTGGLAKSDMLTAWIKKRTQFIAPVFVYPGEDEMLALAEGGLRILNGEEELKKYPAD